MTRAHQRFAAALAGACLLMLWMAASSAAGETAGAGCLACHAERDAALVEQWRRSGHKANAVGCTACHGEDHRNALPRARRNSACTTCHGGADAPVVHSYAASKHGTIGRLESALRDWSLPLQAPNYRSPGCAYCHLHAGQHDTAALTLLPRGGADATMQTACRECHAPRYVARLVDNGERMIEVGRLKLREATELVAAHAAHLSAGGEAEVRALLARMQRHLQNIRLGVGHQSPDYQWWHGQPALDGDLLRIKGLVETARREARLREKEAERQ